MRLALPFERWRPRLALAFGNPSGFDFATTARAAIGAIGLFTVAAFAGLAAVTINPLFTLVAAAGVLVVGIAVVRIEPIERVLTLVLLIGGFILGYGFANMGIHAGPLPLPATEIIFLPLAVVTLLLPGTRPPKSILLPICLFSAIVFARLAFDYPHYGVLAIRDATIGIEVFIVAVGYRAVQRDGVHLWVKRMRIVMMGVLVYGGLLYPWRLAIAELGPTVGLQRPVQLFDARGTKFAVIAAALYFLTFSKGWKRYVAVGLVAGLVGAFQARTLYLLFPVSILVLGWACRQQLRTFLRLIPVIAVGALLVVAMGSLQIEGRRGPIDAAFLEAHARTLLGEEGPMSGSLEGRQEWFRLTMDEVTKSPASIAVGVGLGPDLTFGMLQGKDDQAIRKPHDDYLEVFARLGVIGFIFFVWFLLACLIPMARTARSGDGEEERFCAWLFAACIVYLGVAAAQPLLSFPYGSVPLFFMLGMGVGIAQSRLSERTIRAEVRH
jgi:hypothetical protein